MNREVEVQAESSGPQVAKAGDELLAEFLMERLRRQYDWNVGLNGRASMLLALAGVALAFLLDSEIRVGNGSTWEDIARIVGLVFLVISAAVLLRALRRRPETVWSSSSLGRFVYACRGGSGELVSAALVNRLLSGTDLNERVLSSKSREIQGGTFLTFVGLVFVALGSLGA